MSSEGSADRFPFVDPHSLKKAVIICHRNADADAYLSAYALTALIEGLSPDCVVCVATPSGMTALTERLSKKFPHRPADEGDGQYDLYVAVDVGDAELLEGWLGRLKAGGGVKVLIDHHPLRDSLPYDHVVVDEGATSAAEVVYRLFKELGVTVRADVAQALLEGVLFDSSHLTIACEGGLRAAVHLIDAGADLSKARKDLRSEPDYGEVLARLKGAQRLEIYKVGVWVLATSQVGSFQAQVARSLVFMGADIAVVCGETDGETRVSLRSTQRFYEATMIHLGTQVAEVLGKNLGGHGGGHPTAASFSCNAEEDKVFARTMETVGRLLGAELQEID